MHQLAAFYGVGTYAMGCEPNRYVVVCGSFDISQIPRILSSKKAQWKKLSAIYFMWFLFCLFFYVFIFNVHIYKYNIFD